MTADELVERVAKRWKDHFEAQGLENYIADDEAVDDPKVFARAFCEKLGITAEMITDLEMAEALLSFEPGTSPLAPASTALSLLLEIADG